MNIDVKNPAAAAITEAPLDNITPIVSMGENRTRTRFVDIVGQDQAKQALFENCVIPLTLSSARLAQFMTGIRGGAGNVILYGMFS
jgi:hypothetical protein